MVHSAQTFRRKYFLDILPEIKQGFRRTHQQKSEIREKIEVPGLPLHFQQSMAIALTIEQDYLLKKKKKNFYLLL